jgi:hypothetical protein
VTTPLNDIVIVDPALEKRKIHVHAARLLQGDRIDADGDHRYELAVALHRLGKRWPNGSYHVRGYDAHGLMIVNNFVSENKSLDKDRRHLEASFYAQDLERVEVVFEDDDAPRDADEWLELQTERDQQAEEALSLDVRSLRARAHPDFEYGNLTIVEVVSDLRTTYGLPFPSRLAAQVSVLADDGLALNSSQFDLSVGPTSSRSMNSVVKIYRHEEPSAVRVEFFTT